jgi:methylenetetrahydrofolate reductase (NADPH)
MNSDLRFLKAKVDAGAEYIVTQMFYDNQAFFKFVDDCKTMGINVPIIPGLKPLASRSQLSIIPHHFHINMPDELVQMVEKAKSEEEVRQIGIEWCIQQSKELMKSEGGVLRAKGEVQRTTCEDGAEYSFTLSLTQLQHPQRSTQLFPPLGANDLLGTKVCNFFKLGKNE